MTTVATRRRAGAHAAATPRGTALAGTRTLIRFILRRDRVRIPAWILGITVGTIATAGSFVNLYPTDAARTALAASMNSPAGLAMTGPAEYLADYRFGAMMSHQMLGFTVLLAGLMSILLVVRHTRAEEESGRAELVRAGVVGRHAHLAAALIAVTVANVALALAMAVGMSALGLEQVTWSGSLLYGAAHAAVGIAFAAIAAVTAQVTTFSRGSSGLALAALGLAYVLRAAGDIEGSALSWLSPIGWAQATYVYVDDRWWPLLIAVAFTVALVAVAVGLSTRRDVGAGLRQPRGGASGASSLLVRPVGLAVRLHRGMLVGFGVTALLLGVAYGSVLGDVEGMLGDVEMLEEALAAVGGQTMVESFSSMITIVMAIIVSVYLVMATLRPRSEEQSGRAEPLLATPLSRARWLSSHLAVALIGGAGVMLLAGLGLGATGAAVLDDPGFLGAALGASAAHIPALWVVSGITVALYGLAPRAATLAWIVPLYAFVAGYLGQILQFPDWMNNLSPFGHVPRMPAEDFSVVPLLGLTAVAAALIAFGIAAFRRRGIHST